MQQIYRRTPMPKCDFNKVESCFATLLKSHFVMGVPVNLLHIFRTPFPRNTSGWLLLFISYRLSRSKGLYCFLQFVKECNYFRVICLFFLAVYNKQEKVPLTRLDHLVFYLSIYVDLIPQNVFRFMLFLPQNKVLLHCTKNEVFH